MPLPRCFLSASGGLSRRALLRFRLRASDFLGRQKVTKDRFKDPWSLKISFHQSLGLACLRIRRSVSRRGSLPPAAARGQSKNHLPPTGRRLAVVVIRAWETVLGRFQICRRGGPAWPPGGVWLRYPVRPANLHTVGRGLAPAALVPPRIGWCVAESPTAGSPEGENFLNPPTTLFRYRGLRPL